MANRTLTMTLDEIKQILDLVREHELSEFELEQEGVKLRVRKKDCSSPIRRYDGGDCTNITSLSHVSGFAAAVSRSCICLIQSSRSRALTAFNRSSVSFNA